MGTDAMFNAIETGDRDALAALLAERPGLATASRDGVPALRLTAYGGYPELRHLLVEHGAVPDVFDAAALGDVDALRDALDDDPGLTGTTAADGFTALHLASWFGHPKAVELLLARGADPEHVATNATLLRPLHSAAAGGHVVIVHQLLDLGADVEAAQIAGVRPLHTAAHRNDHAMVALLLGRGADPSATTDDGRTARDLATDPEISRLLPE